MYKKRKKMDKITAQQLTVKFKSILPYMNEEQKRLLLAVEAKYIGWGGVSQVSKASGVSPATIRKALKKLQRQ